MVAEGRVVVGGGAAFVVVVGGSVVVVGGAVAPMVGLGALVVAPEPASTPAPQEVRSTSVPAIAQVDPGRRRLSCAP